MQCWNTIREIGWIRYIHDLESKLTEALRAKLHEFLVSLHFVQTFGWEGFLCHAKNYSTYELHSFQNRDLDIDV